MTDFLSRVAARAVGATPAARPRLAGLFESAGTAGDPTIDVVDEEAVAPAAAPRLDAPAARVDVAPPPTPPADVPAASIVRPHETERAVVAPPPAERAPGPPAADHEPARDPLPPPAPARGRLPAATQAASVSHATVVAAAPLARALPATRVGGPSNSLSLGSAAPAREEPPPVRVHIGRLEVRANVQSPQPERPRREAPRPDGLSLADYLRGKREVRS